MISKQLDIGEITVVVIRKHWIIFVLRTLLIMLGMIAPLVAYAFIPTEALNALSQIMSGVWALFVYMLFVLFLWIIIFIDFTTYHLDVWVVTNRRIIDINQRTLFSRDTTTLMLEKIQDATVEVRGLLATIFNFGTLTIHTAGENPDIVIHYASDPIRSKDKILASERDAVSRKVASDGL